MDPRDEERAMGKWYDHFDRDRMILTFTYVDDEDEERELKLPAVFEVCDLCGGRGKHVNPGVDAGGISQEDFYDDPDFAEDYFGGMYDVPCYRCGGKNVEPVVDMAQLSRDQQALWNKIQSDREYEARERAAELEYGY
jgi:hypothetical protein